MDEDFNVEEFRPAVYRPDTELTLNPMMMLGLFFGLMLLCGLCFGVGYSMGIRAAHNSPATGQQPSARAASQAAGSLLKPSASPQNIPQKPLAATALHASEIKAGTAPTISPAGTLMVQIATVSHQEDADVLVGALRQRGYAVTASRDAADHQFHVRIGPFNNHNDANAMRQKLLHDGYNAIVQP